MSKLNQMLSSYRLLSRHVMVRKCLAASLIHRQSDQGYCSLIKKSPNDFEVKESEDLNFDYQQINIPENLKMDKLINLNLQKKLTPISKPGSFTADLFLGKLDVDFLFYPKLITSRKEYISLHLQNTMIERNFRDTVCKENAYALLQNYGFLNIWKLSMTERCSIFEAMGASMCEGILYEQLLNPNAKKLHGTDLMKVYDPNYKNLFVRLLLHNLAGSCLTFADPEKEIVKKYKELLDQGARIGFAFNETEGKLGSLPFSDWSTVAELSEDKKSWIVTGAKNKIFDGNYDHYIVFAKTRHYPEDEHSKYKTKYEEPYDGIVCFLVDKDQLQISSDETNNLDDPEFNYHRLEMKYLRVPRENELFEAEEYGCSALSCRGIGILFTTSYQLGFLKSLQRQIYRFFVANKSEFLDCKATQSILFNLTEINYTLEAMNYMVAAMYDSFDTHTFPDMTLETSILKSFAVEESRQFLVKLQSLFGSKLFEISKYHNLINLIDSLFDSSLHHRLFTASVGAHFVGVFRVNDIIKLNLPVLYPTFQLYHKWKLRRDELDDPALRHDARGHLHPKLALEGDKLEYAINRLQYGAYLSVERYKKEINEEQFALLMLSEIVSHVFALTAVLSRASRAEIEGVQNSEQEIYIARQATRHRVHQVKFLIERLEDFKFDLPSNMYDSQVHKNNVRFNGYFPYPPTEVTY